VESVTKHNFSSSVKEKDIPTPLFFRTLLDTNPGQRTPDKPEVCLQIV
jgi:hypothetical protein